MPSAQHYPKTRGLALSALFATLLAVSSLIALPLPFSPVPVTLQVLMVFLASSLLGPRYSALACLIYLLFGSIGLPVFAGGAAGPTALFGPTGGYLFAFPIGAFLGALAARKTATAASRKGELSRVLLGIIIALTSIYLLGVLWLAVYLGINLGAAFYLGAAPFLPFDLAKAIIAVPISLQLRRNYSLQLPVQEKYPPCSLTA